MSTMNGLRAQFYDAAQFELNGQSWGFKPSAAFEVAHGLSGIASYYKFPAVTIDGETTHFSLFFEHHVTSSYSNAVFGCYENPRDNGFQIVKIADLDPALMQRMQDDWKILMTLNPELSAVQVDMHDPLNLFDALTGVSCLLNIDDLNIFLKGRVETKSMAADPYLSKIPGYEKMRDDVNSFFGVQTLGWIAAPQTLQRIKDKMQP